MDRYIVIALLGLGAGALYGALAQGLVLAYRASGVVNFAHGAMAMYVAYTFSELRLSGDLVVLPLPNPLAPVEWLGSSVGNAEWDLPDWPTFISLGGPMAFWPAFALSLVVAALLGLALHFLVFRPLRSSPPLAKVVASVGVMLTLQAIALLRFGPESRAVPRILTQSTVEVLGEPIALDRFILAGMVLVLAGLLWALFRWTRIGWATQASAENEKGAILTGLSPDRLAGASWILASVIAGFFGVLFSTITTLTPTNFTLFILPALAVALVAGFASFPIAAVAGLATGALEGITVLLPSDVSWLPEQGLGRALPLLIVIVVLFTRSRPIPSRGEVIDHALPAAPEPRRAGLTLGVVAVVFGVGAIWLPFAYRGALINSLIGVAVALSLVVVVGFLGQISLMQMALAGMAAFAMTTIAGDWGVPFPISCVLAALVATLLGLLTSAPALRIRGVQLAIVTLASAVAFEALVLRNPSILSDSDAVASVPAPELFGIRFGVNDSFFIERDGIPNPGFALGLLVVVLLLCAVVMNWRRNTTGRLFLAVRSNERAAAAAGIDVARVKLLGFAASAFVAGVAGSLGAYRFEGVSADGFAVFTSITALAVAYLGGISTVGGALVAGLLVTQGISSQVMESIFHAPQFELLISGVGLILTAILNPVGIAGAFREMVAHVSHRVHTTRRPHASDRPVPAGEGSYA